MNCQPGKLLMNFLCSLPGLLGPKMLCLSRVSQCSLGPSPYHGLQVRLLCRGGLLLRFGGLLLCRGGLLLRSGGLLLRRGGLLLRSGGLPLRLFQSGGLQLCRGGLLPCLLCTGGLQSCLLHPGGLQSRLLHPGGLQSRLLHPGGLQSRLLCPVGLQSRSLSPLLRLRSTALLDCIGASGSHSLGGGYVTNPVHALPFTRHQRSLAHHMDSCTTLTVACHQRLHFP